MIWRVHRLQHRSVPRRSLKPAKWRSEGHTSRGTPPVPLTLRSPATIIAQANVGASDSSNRSKDQYDSYVANPGSPPRTSPADGSSSNPSPSEGTWPSGGAYTYSSSNDQNDGSGWKDQTPAGAGVYGAWSQPSADWGEYVAAGEWGQHPEAQGPEPSPYNDANYQASASDGAAAGAAATPQGAWPADEGASGASFQRAAATSGAAGGGFGAFDADSYRGSGGAAGATPGPPPPPPGAAGWGVGMGAGSSMGGAAGWAGAGQGAGPLPPSDVTLITPRDAELVLPVLPTSEQARHYQPKSVPERVVQVLGSIGVSAALSKSALLAGPALLYPIWGPWMRAGARNVELYLRQFKRLGLWRAQVLSVDIQVMPYAYVRAAAFGSQYSAADSVSVVVGDPWPGGARAQLRFPYTPGCEELVVGESAEMMVLCRDNVFQSFKVVREVYFPQSGLWLAEYPFVNRDVFLDISLAVERGRQAQQAQQAEQGQEPGAWNAPGAGPRPEAAAAAAAAAAWGPGGGPQRREQRQAGGGGDVVYASYRPYEAEEGTGAEAGASYGAPYVEIDVGGFGAWQEYSYGDGGGGAVAGGEASSSGGGSGWFDGVASGAAVSEAYGGSGAAPAHGGEEAAEGRAEASETATSSGSSGDLGRSNASGATGDGEAGSSSGRGDGAAWASGGEEEPSPSGYWINEDGYAVPYGGSSNGVGPGAPSTSNGGGGPASWAGANGAGRDNVDAWPGGGAGASPYGSPTDAGQRWAVGTGQRGGAGSGGWR